MAKRPLSKDEKGFALKQVGRIEAVVGHLEWLEEYNDLMVNKGHMMNYLEKVRAGKEHKKDLRGELKMEREKLKVLLGQIEGGVEIKKVEPERERTEIN